MTNSATPNRDDIKTTAMDLFIKNQDLQQESMFVVQEPDQTLRAVLAQAYSLANATNVVLQTLFNAIGYQPPVYMPFGGPTVPKDTGVEITAQHLVAGSLLCELAADALQSAVAAHDFYKQSKANRDAGNDSVQLPEPDVQGEQFLADLAARTTECDFADLRYSTSTTRYLELRAKYGNRLNAAALYLEVSGGLLKGFKEDLIVARGEELKVDASIQAEAEKALDELQAPGDGGEGDFLVSIMNDLFAGLGADGMVGLMMDSIGVESVGSRLGFLVAAKTEGQLASKALDLLVSELANIEPIDKPGPCLVGSHGSKTAEADGFVPPDTCLLGPYAPTYAAPSTEAPKAE